MSVRRADYIMVAVDLNHMFNDESYEQLEELEEAGLDVVSDCMSDQYTFIGKIIDKAKDYNGFKVFQYNPNVIDSIAGKVKQQIKQELGIEVEPKLTVFTNWS